MSKQFFVYIMNNGPKSAVLYTGITGDLRRRVWSTKTADTGFYRRYNLTRLVYYETFRLPRRGYLPRKGNQKLGAQQ